MLLLILDTLTLIDDAIDEVEGINARYGNIDAARSVNIPDFYSFLVSPAERNLNIYPTCPSDIQESRLRLMAELDEK